MTDAQPCPNCGAPLPVLLAHARMANCDFCGTSVVREDKVLRQAGQAGEMLEAPALVTLGRPVILGTFGAFSATGHVRYDYGRGHWDEYHGQLDDGTFAWVSVDEGDVAVQVPLENAPEVGGRPRIGTEVTVEGVAYTCNEVDSARATAFRGQLPEEIVIGETHMFANFAGPRGAILSAEFWEPGQSAWFRGTWVDPFDVTQVGG